MVRKTRVTNNETTDEISLEQRDRSVFSRTSRGARDSVAALTSVVTSAPAAARSRPIAGADSI